MIRAKQVIRISPDRCWKIYMWCSGATAPTVVGTASTTTTATMKRPLQLVVCAPSACLLVECPLDLVAVGRNLEGAWTVKGAVGCHAAYKLIKVAVSSA